MTVASLTTTGLTQIGVFSKLNPTTALLTVENDSGTAAQFMSNAAVPGATAIGIRSDRTDGAFALFFFGAAGVGGIATNGTTTAYNTVSDEELKIDGGLIREEESGSIIDRLLPRWFRWKVSPDGAPQMGFFAQQVARVFPRAVTVGHAAPGAKDFRPWQMDEAKIMPVVIAELRALRRRVAELEAGAA
jgi:hypothetical protein